MEKKDLKKQKFEKIILDDFLNINEFKKNVIKNIEIEIYEDLNYVWYCITFKDNIDHSVKMPKHHDNTIHFYINSLFGNFEILKK